jgi:type II secretory pathway predicted ATPase ExeA
MTVAAHAYPFGLCAVWYRLKHAGADRELFSSDAIALIHEETHGRLRDIDRIATDALRLGGRRKIRDRRSRVRRPGLR